MTMTTGKRHSLWVALCGEPRFVGSADATRRVHTRRPQMRAEGQRVDPTPVGLVSIDDGRSARCGRATLRDPQLVRSSFWCVIAQPSASCVGNGFGNETRRIGRDGVECGVMAWTVEKS